MEGKLSKLDVVCDPQKFFHSELDQIIEEFEGSKRMAERKKGQKANKKKVSLSETDINNFAGMESSLGVQVQPKVGSCY